MNRLDPARGAAHRVVRRDQLLPFLLNNLSRKGLAAPLNSHTFRALEFEAIRGLVLGHTGSEAGRARIQRLAPAVDPSAVREALGRTTEAATLLRSLGRQPFHDLPDLGPILPASRVDGLHLEPPALLDVASFAEGGGEICWRIGRAEGAPRLSRLAARWLDTADLARAIRRAILPGGEVSDNASPRLAETRRTLARLKTQLHSVMESYLHGKDADRLLQDKIITTRNDRYVLPLKAEQRSQVPGIVHGGSGSGASVFVEPLPAVELNNDIVTLQDEERREVIRILRELTVQVGQRAEALEDGLAIVGELDALQAMALAARDMDAVEPIVDEAGTLELRQGRHPLLIPRVNERLGTARRAGREPVPVSLKVGAGEPVLVISGPNTGGKTVTLKTVGLLALMAQCGLHVAAAAGTRLPVFRRVFADIGDDQSIENSLSTFSAHLATIVEMAGDLEQPALVLLDEVGAGTDPSEGGALGVAIVDHFMRHGAMVVATTHLGLLKAYAQSTPGVGCASFGYDPQTYAPTYRLEQGTAGRSLALEMAERLGLPAAVVADARSRLDRREAQAEALLKTLEQDQAELARGRERLTEQEEALAKRALLLDDREHEAAGQRRREAEAFRAELQRRTEQMAREAAEAIRAAVKRLEETRRSAVVAGEKARQEAMAGIRQAEAAALSVPELAAPAPPPAAAGGELRVGSRVRVQTLGVMGEVMALSGRQAEVTVGGKRLRVPVSELTVLGQPKSGAGWALRTESPVSTAGNDMVPSEINVVGLTVDEALPRVDKLLDEAALSERREVRVVHGFGSGRLRKAVAGLLHGHPHVATFHAAEPSHGGGGVTVVELKD